MSYPEERDKAFIEFVKNDNIKPFVKLCKKYGLVRPKSWKLKELEYIRRFNIVQIFQRM